MTDTAPPHGEQKGGEANNSVLKKKIDVEV